MVSAMLVVFSLALAAAAPGSGTAQTGLALQAFTEGSGPPLVMLGGGTFGAIAFAPHAHRLAKDFQVIRLQTLNLETAGNHEPLPAGYSVDLESRAMGNALDRLNIKGPADIVGWSFGGLVAIKFALDHPEWVRTLALYEPPAFWALGQQDLSAMPDLRKMIELTGELVPNRAPTDEQYVRFLCALGNCGAKPPAAGQPDVQDWVTRRSALRGLSAVSSYTDTIARLKAFPRPVLIMTGTSTVPFHRRINEILAANFPLAERIGVTGDHRAPVSAEEEFVATLRAFIARHPGASAIAQDVTPEAAIRAIIAEQAAAWNAGDAAGYAKHVSPDVSFTNLFGMVMYGAPAFTSRHADILATFYKGTTKHHAIRRIRFVTRDVAIADIDNEVRGVKAMPTGIVVPPDGVIKTQLMEVFVRRDGRWSIEAYHNVDVKTAAGR